ncbi:MAG: hypothetical protein WCI06_03350 [Methylococcaceae bacterium]
MINSHRHTIADLALQVGIDFNRVAERLYYETNGQPISGNIAIDKKAREGNPYIHVNAPFIDSKGNKYPNITFGTHAHGGFTVNFNGYREAQADKPAWIDYPKPKPIIKPITPIADNKWRIKAFQAALVAFNLANNDGVEKHFYVVKKVVNTADCDIRLVNGLLQYAIHDITGKLLGFQTINSDGNKRFIGSTGGGFVVIGNADMIQFGAIFVEGLATGLSAYHSETLNPHKLPVVVCLDAGNMRKVIAAFVEKYGKDCVNLYADNDCGLNSKGEFTGNTGVFVALEICQQHDISSYRLPVMNGEKCDFNDTQEFMDVEVPTGNAYQIELIKVAPKQSLNKLIWQYAYQICRETRIDAKPSDETAEDLAISECVNLITSMAIVVAVASKQTFKSFKNFTHDIINGAADEISDDTTDEIAEFLTPAEAIASIIQIATLRDIDVEIEAKKFVHKMIVRQVTRQLAYQVPSKLSAERAAIATIAELEKYGMTGNQADIEIQIENDVKRRRELCRYLNKITDFTGLQRHLVDGYETWRIAERLDCENDTGHKNMFVDTRGMGAGKTQLMAERIKRMPYAAYITHRTALVADACKTLGLESYKDGDIYADKIGICINSLLKFAAAVRGMPLFIDEARQVYDTIINSTTIENRRALIDCFIDILESASSIHLADANMNDETLAFYRRHCGGKKIHLIEATAVESKVNHWLLPDLDACKFSILKKLGQGGRGLVGCTSEKEAKKTRLFLIKNGVDPKRILLCYSKNKGDKRVAAFLADVNGEGVKYDVIIHTSVLGSGVSVVIPEFTFTYLLCSNVLASNESMQMLARNRCAKDVFVAFGAQLNDKRVTNLDVLKKGAIDKVKNFAGDLGIDVTTIFDELGTAQVLATSNLHADLNDFANNLLLLAEIEGRNFVRVEKIEGEKTVGLGAEVDAQTVVDIEAAVIIDKAEYKRIENSNNPTQEESDSVDRYKVGEMTGTGADIVTIDIENYLDGAITVLANYELIDADTETLKTADRANFETRNKQKSATSRQKIIKKVLLPLQTAMDENGGFTKNEALLACMVLKKYHAELAGEFGDYNKRTFIRPTKTIGYFVEKFGFEVNAIGQKSTGKRGTIFQLKVNDDILRYATNRKACKRC